MQLYVMLADLYDVEPFNTRLCDVFGSAIAMVRPAVHVFAFADASDELINVKGSDLQHCVPPHKTNSLSRCPTGLNFWGLHIW